MSSPFSFKFTAAAIGLLSLGACNPASQTSTPAPAPQTPAATPASATLAPCPNNIALTPGTCLFTTTGFYTSKEPYVPRQLPGSYTPAPEGFSVGAVQHAARHGSRALSSADDDDLMYQLWQQARQETAQIANQKKHNRGGTVNDAVPGRMRRFPATPDWLLAASVQTAATHEAGRARPASPCIHLQPQSFQPA